MGLPLIAVPEDKGRRRAAPWADMLALLRHGRLACRAGAARRDRARQPADRGRRRRAKLPVRRRWRWATLKLSGGRLSGKVERVPFASVADRFVAVVGGTAGRGRQGQRQGRGQAQPCRRALRHGDVRQCRGRVQRRLAGERRARASSWPPSCAPCRWPAPPTRCWRPPSNIPSSAVQFGRSISTFQAIQHMLAELASCVAATIASAEAGGARRRRGRTRRRRTLLDRRRQEPGLRLRPAHRRHLAPVDGRHGLHPRAHPASLHAQALGVAPRLRQRDLLGREDRRGLRQGRPRRAVGLAERQQVRGIGRASSSGPRPPSRASSAQGTARRAEVSARSAGPTCAGTPAPPEATDSIGIRGGSALSATLLPIQPMTQPVCSFCRSHPRVHSTGDFRNFRNFR